MSIGAGIERLRSGFQRSFWVANVMELFERIAYYGQQVVFTVFIRSQFERIESPEAAIAHTGRLNSLFGGLLYFLPIFAGTLADRYGFRRAFAVAFSGLSIGYFAIGATGMEFMKPHIAGLPLFWVLAAVLIFTAMPGALIKPSVLGTVAKTSTPGTKSLGYAIYYTLVNIGGAVGPAIAYFTRARFGIASVYVVSSVSCALMFLTTLFLYREPKTEGAPPTATLGQKIADMFRVLANVRFIVFLLIFSLYWIMFWQIFVIIPLYITDFIAPHWTPTRLFHEVPFEIVESMDAWAIIFLQVIINRMTHKLRTVNAIIVGFAVSSLCWVVIAMHPNVWTIIAGLVVFSLGEMTQAPRYYEYIADHAPKGQEALFQGYAFLPIAIAWVVGGTLGASLYSSIAAPLIVREGTAIVGATGEPTRMWLALAVVGVVATLLMALYNQYLNRAARAAHTS